MPSTGRRGEGAGLTVRTFAVIAGVTIAARLPFLLRADRFFDADEAVEGLMARHIGDHSFFLWGQRYKGTPEVFLTAPVFRIAGSSVIALKAVTLACFVAFLCLNFRVLERAFSRGVAWIATAFFVVGPPSLVLWTLSGSAEMVMTWLAGAVLLLAVASSQTATLKGSSCIAAAALGVGLWIQQYILYYVVSLAITAVILRSPMPAWGIPRWLRPILSILAAVAVLYMVFGLVAFFTPGFDARVGDMRITVTHPQKMWWIAGVVLMVDAGLVALAAFRTKLVKPGIAFLAGYSPAIIGRIGNHGLGAPIARLDFGGLRQALPDVTNVMLPMLFGWRDPLARPTVFPVLGLALLLLAAVSYWHTHVRRMVPFFHVFPFVAAGMFLVSGSYIDVQSYRYLMPIYAALPVIYAVGIDGVSRISRVAGSALLVFVLLIFAAQQIDWYVQLTPDRQTPEAIACLDSAGIRAARAPYWQSYPITFLTRERIIVSPTDGIDRYAPYSAITRSTPTLAQVCPGRPEGLRY